jgi:hypothetical protein
MNSTSEETIVKLTPAAKSGISRLAMVSAMLGSAILGSACNSAVNTVPVAAQSVSDVDILNFALNLEYLEAEFYSVAVTGATIEANGAAITGTGTSGGTTGGNQVAFTDSTTKAIAAEIQVDELTHVKFLRSVLGSQAIAKPAINLAGLGIGFASMAQFLVLSRAFEDTGVTAYAGAAPLISSKAYLAAAAEILAVEAYHAGSIRTLIAQQNISTNPPGPLDSQDVLPPPTGSQYFPTDVNSLAMSRTTTAVIAIAKPFFPNGLNGNIH